MKKYVLARIRPHDCLLTVETVQCSTYWANCIFIFTVNNNNNNIFIVNEILGNNSACNVYVIISWFWCLKIMEILLLVHTSCRSLTNSCSCLHSRIPTASTFADFMDQMVINRLSACSILTSLSTVLWLWCCIISDYITALYQIHSSVDRPCF